MKKIVIVAMCLGTIAAISFFQYKKQTSETSIPLEQNFSTDFAYDSKLFMSGISAGQSMLDKNIPQLNTLIIPHHLTASRLIVQGIIQLGYQEKPKNVVILSPNHLNIGSCSVITSNKSWSTPYGTSEINKQYVSDLLAENSICIDDQNIKIEHGVAGLLPYLKYYYPDTKIIPLAFKKSVTMKDLDILSQKISQLPQTVVLASIDFSHGLPPSESEAKDKATQNLINNYDFEKIANLNSQYLDSPAALITLLKVNKIKDYQQVLIAHTDASEITQKDSEDSTSYMVYGSYIRSKANKTWSLIATGDVMLGRTVNTQSIKNNDFTWAFKNISSLLKSADLTLINLESPLINNCQPTDKGMVFCGRADHIQGLESAGVDIAHIANNHINNYGLSGVDETISILKSKNISSIGLGNIVVKNIAGTTVAFVGFDAVNKLIDTEVKKTISETKKQYPLVVASFHWGTEYQRNPNKRQIELAHLAIDSGADIIIGHHPHWVQTEEIYKEKPIFYSLGNLIFDQMWSEETKKGMIIKLNFSADKLTSTDHFPVNIYDYGQPKLATQVQTP